MELDPTTLAPQYRSILADCEPYLVTFSGNHAALDLEPFGLRLDPERIYDPTRLRSRGVIDGLHKLDRFSFGGQDMPMPRWVLFDCGEFPGVVFGFGRVARELAAPLRQAYDLCGPEHDDTFVPLSMWVAIRMAQQDAWFGHNLSSANYVAPDHARPGLGTITKAFGVRLIRVRRQYGATQWASPSVGLHLRLGTMELLGAYTPAHTHVETFTYRIDVEPGRLVAPLQADWRRPSGGGARKVDANRSDEITALHQDLEAGQRWALRRVERHPGRAQRLWLDPVDAT